MKANEAPDEIYLLPDDRNPNGLSICWYGAPYSTGAIEYTRTDAFIEKAVKWIEEINNHHHIMRYSDSYEPPLSELTEWFRKYMEGE